MNRKIYLSFLGTNNYVECNYYEEGNSVNKISNVKYVQEALLQMYCSDFTDEDIAFFFLTKDAREQNWNNDGQWNRDTGKYDLKNVGLYERLQRLKSEGIFKGQIEPVPIDEGFSTEEIWRIFSRVFGILEKKDEVILDITHAFRSLPMLGMVLLNYAKALEDIRVKAIYYGAFEKLGPATVVAKKPIKDRNAPILNLVSFAELQDWRIAADNFSRSGDSSGITELTKKKITPILKTTKGGSIPAKTLDGLSKNLALLSGNLTTNRGNSILNGQFIKNINTNLKLIENNDTIIPALRPILQKINQKLASFNSDLPNWVAAVEWCFDHNLIQQGITQLQEGLLSHFCREENNYFIELDPSEEDDRTVISQSMLIIKKRIPQADWYKPASQNIEIVKALISNKQIQNLAAPYQSLTKLRNDINHGGYLSKKPPKKFKKELEKKFNIIKKILEID